MRQFWYCERPFCQVYFYDWMGICLAGHRATLISTQKQILDFALDETKVTYR